MSETPIRVDLGPMDHLMPTVYTAAVCYLAMKPGVSATEVFAYLQEGLHRTFLQVPWLSGKVHRQARDTPGWRPGKLEIRYSPSTADGPQPYQFRFNELESATHYPDLKASAFPLDTFDDKDLLWVETWQADLDVGVEVVVAQANFMPGACLLAFGMYHPSSDATGMAIIFKLWVDNCRSLHSQHIPPESDLRLLLRADSWDRMLVDNIWAKEGQGCLAAGKNLATWDMVGLEPPSTNGSVPPMTARRAQQARDSQMQRTIKPRVFKSRVFYMSPAAFMALRKKCNEELGTTDVSGNDILMALIWCSLIKARTAALAVHNIKVDMDGLVEIQVPVDGRPDFSQHMALPQTYIGNMVVYHMPVVPLRALVGPDTTTSIAQTIRTSARNINHQTMLDGYSLLRQIPDYGLITPMPRASQEGTWLISSMLMVPDDTCFSDQLFHNHGRPDGVRPLMSGRNKFEVPVSFIMPRKKSGGIEFTVSMFEDELEFFMEDEELGRYAFLLA